jgi:hypothetical protein
MTTALHSSVRTGDCYATYIRRQEYLNRGATVVHFTLSLTLMEPRYISHGTLISKNISQREQLSQYE